MESDGERVPPMTRQLLNTPRSCSNTKEAERYVRYLEDTV